MIDAISSDKDCIALHIRYCMNICTCMQRGNIAYLQFVVCPSHSNCGLVDGYELSLANIGETFRSVQASLWKVMNEHLFFGFLHVIESTFCGILNRCPITSPNGTLGFLLVPMNLTMRKEVDCLPAMTWGISMNRKETFEGFFKPLWTGWDVLRTARKN